MSRHAQPWRLPGGLVGGLVGLLALVVAPGCRRGPVPTPAAAVPPPRVSPYRNTAAGVPYVGNATCAQCHVDLAETYHRHPMGRSFAPVMQSLAGERYGEAAQNPFERLGFSFQVERRPEGMVHKAQRRDARGRVLTEADLPIQFVIGSGTHGSSYLADRNGYLFESPISWFAPKKAWDLSPAFERLYPPERVVEPSCLFCHTNYAEAVEQTRNRYREPIFRGYAIGCERCHGPGALHVQRQEAGEPAADPDDTIVNPARLPPALREAVCQQCHLQGKERFVRPGHKPFDYRPGLPLHMFWAVFVAAPEFTGPRRAIGQVEQMYRSRCFQASNGKMGCISCHDPHELPAAAQRVAYYRRRCLSCHQEQSCALPPATRRAQEAQDSCTACHMPRLASSDIAHTALTDHRLLRRPDPAAPPGSEPRSPRPGEIPIVNFYQQELDPEDAANARDLGVALSYETHNAGPQRGPLIPLALPLLAKGVEQAPADVEAWEALGWLLSLQGRGAEGLAAYQNALAGAPERELSLYLAATLAEHLGRPDEALPYLRRLLRVNPWLSEYHYRLAKLLALRGEWPEALAACAQALQLNPASDETRVLLITCCLRAGKKDRAQEEFDKLLALRPNEDKVWRSWWNQQQP